MPCGLLSSRLLLVACIHGLLDCHLCLTCSALGESSQTIGTGIKPEVHHDNKLSLMIKFGPDIPQVWVFSL